jgi:hypothetical protein
LHCCDQIPKKSNLRKEGIILACGFRGFIVGLLGPLHLGKTSWWWGYVAEEVLYQLLKGRKIKRRAWGTGITFKGMPPLTHFFHLVPTSQNF